MALVSAGVAALVGVASSALVWGLALGALRGFAGAGVLGEGGN